MKELIELRKEYLKLLEETGGTEFVNSFLKFQFINPLPYDNKEYLRERIAQLKGE
jgi:hypothetical protein